MTNFFAILAHPFPT